MKVFDVLTESKKTQVDEGPLRFAKRTLFKNTAMGKKAQVSAEIDAEAKRMYKQLIADIENYNDPRLTVNNVAQWAQGAGFISDRSQVIKMLRANPTFANKLDAVAGTVKKGAKAAGKAAKVAGQKVKATAGAIKKKLTPEPSEFEKGKQGELDLQSMYNESRFITEVEQSGLNIELSRAEVMNVLRGFVKKGRQAGMAGGKYTQRSSYADSDGKATAKKAKADTSGDTGSQKQEPMISPEFASAVSVIKKAGFKVVDRKGNTVKV